jgi:V8-like Glu-specific endopeptidase
VETDEERLEKIIGANTLRPIAFLAQGLQAAKSVVFINVNGGTERWSGTGFLVSNDLVLTNHHVIPDDSLLAKTVFRFNYEDNFRGESQKVYEYYAKSNGIYYSNKKLDYTLMQLQENAGKDWGALHLSAKISTAGERVNIIQHPAGQPKQISLQNNFVQYIDETVIQYVTSTLPGSSGSPVLNDEWEVIAIHHAGGNIQEPATKRSHFRNEGILTKAILDDLPPTIKQLIHS